MFSVQPLLSNLTILYGEDANLVPVTKLGSIMIGASPERPGYQTGVPHIGNLQIDQNSVA